jgi:short-subunit dehydrogenase
VTEFHDRSGTGRSHAPSWLWLSSDRVVDESLAQIRTGGSVICVPTKRFKLIVFLLRYLPAWMQKPLRRRDTRARTA